MKRTLLSLLALLIAGPALAQDAARPVFIVSNHQCNSSQLRALTERNRERAAPIYQSMVDEGKMIQAGEAVHQWGDEYNLITWLAAADMPTALDAWREMTSRYAEAHPDDRLFIETCPKHRDNFYTLRSATQANNPPAGEGNEPTLAISYYTCDYTKLGEIVRDGTERSQPLAQALVDEGVLRSQALYTHLWGDEWNLAISRTATDLPALLTALRTMDERYETQYGADERSPIEEHCTAHKDNIYTMTISTAARSNE